MHMFDASVQRMSNECANRLAAAKVSSGKGKNEKEKVKRARALYRYRVQPLTMRNHEAISSAVVGIRGVITVQLIVDQQQVHVRVNPRRVPPEKVAFIGTVLPTSRIHTGGGENSLVVPGDNGNFRIHTRRRQRHTHCNEGGQSVYRGRRWILTARCSRAITNSGFETCAHTSAHGAH